MFQDFTESADPNLTRERVVRLRNLLADRSLDGFLVPRADRHQGEYVAPHSERLAWLTGFTGSAGLAIVLQDQAAIFVDGRYVVQVLDQIDQEIFSPIPIATQSPGRWLQDAIRPGARIGFDPWLTTRTQSKRFAEAVKTGGGELVPVAENLIDMIWEERPDPHLSMVFTQPEEMTGARAADKIAAIVKHLGKAGADATILTDPASIAWLFNIRGHDIPHTPTPLAFAMIPAMGPAALFIEGAKLNASIRGQLTEFAEIREISELEAVLGDLGASGSTILIDPDKTAEAIAAISETAGGGIIEGADPVELPKARKSPAELQGSRTAHIRDGAAMVKFLCWLESQPGDGRISEIDAAKRLEQFRVAAGNTDGMPLADISFDTISASGPNSAIVHHRVTESTNRPLSPGEVFLVDSGAQYQDGTTDITRTLVLGNIGHREQGRLQDRYTRVLKGHIAIASARFPAGTSGAQLDALARSALWRTGLDFDHGTGHGVGSFLSVHEGPQRISKTGAVPLEPGMIVSNEPGFYVTGEFGIRIENLLAVGPASSIPGGDRELLGFETLTLAPISKKLIAPHLLDPWERAWLDLYHQRVYGSLSFWPDFTQQERQWLAAACSPLET